MSTFTRLTKVFNSSKEIPIDDTSKFILMSDVHRGDNSWADDFAHNQNLLFAALNHYYDKGFTYIEIGDGDELWENRKFSVIRNSHSHIFEVMRKFHIANRLIMIFGNHDMVKKNKNYIKKNLYYYYDENKEKHKPLFENIEIHEGIILSFKDNDRKIFITHGHQGDLINDYLWKLGRFLVRYLWRFLSLYFGFKDPTSPAKNNKRKKSTERKISEWVEENNQMIIVGHTHRPTVPNPGSTPYFNTGSCVHPRGITGIEIENGKITLIKWSVTSDNNDFLKVTREIIAGPRDLNNYFEK